MCPIIALFSYKRKRILAWHDEDGVAVLGHAIACGQSECIDAILGKTNPAVPCGGAGGNTVLHVAAMQRGGDVILMQLMSPTRSGEPFDLKWLELRNR